MSIAYMRKQKGMSQEDLSKKLGLTQGTISQWENGVTLPTADKLPEIAKVLDCTIDDLFHDE